MDNFTAQYFWQRWIKWIITGVIALILVSMFTGTYNSLTAMGQEVDSKWSQVQNVLQMRFDKIPNLVEVVKGYATHEKAVFDDIANARSKLAGARTADEQVAASGELSGALSRLLVITENYPDLKADTQFIYLQDEISGTENRLMIARKDYNEAVKSYNTKTASFPSNLFARAMGFAPRKYFEAAAGSEEAPKVKF